MTDGDHASAGGLTGFRKKSFTPGTFLSGTAEFVCNLPALIRARRADRVSTQLAEKIMLAVTAVNECQYCARFHTQVAQGVGVEADVVDDILQQDIGTTVEAGEREALLFAQQYAETNQEPGDKAVQAFVEEYGTKMAADIIAFSRAIYWGNMVGNTFDAVRFSMAKMVTEFREKLR